MAKSYPRPKFVREESWRYKRVKSSWRAPRGKTSRVRRSKKGWPAVVKIGYAHPRATKWLHPSGFHEVLVHRPQEVAELDPKTQAIRIAHTVGANKRQKILDEANKANLKVLNPGPKKEPEPEALTEPVPVEVAEKETKPEAVEAPAAEPREQAAAERKPKSRTAAGKKLKTKERSN